MDNELRKQLDEAISALDSSERYRVDAVLKDSGLERTERVYLVEDASEQGPFIRKIFPAETGANNVYARLLEAQRAGKRFLHLPHILDCTQTESECTVVMEYIAGHTLSDEVYQQDASPQLATRLFPQVCEAVQELHEGFDPAIIHRDIKPSNIMVAWNGVYLIDLGISRSFNTTAHEDTRHLGTKAYAPPEQFGYSQTDERSDVYALGMLLYYILTEQNPDPMLAGSNFADAAIPAELRPVLTRATSFDPANRYQSVRELKKAFLAAAATEARRQNASPNASHAPLSGKADRSSEALAAAASTAPHASPHAESAGFLARIPRKLGIALDALCIGWIVLMAIAAVATIAAPNSDSSFALMAPATRAIASIACALFAALPAIAIVDRRPFYRFFPVLEKISVAKQLAAIATAAVACIVVIALTATAR